MRKETPIRAANHFGESDSASKCRSISKFASSSRCAELGAGRVASLLATSHKGGGDRVEEEISKPLGLAIVRLQLHELCDQCAKNVVQGILGRESLAELDGAGVVGEEIFAGHM